MDYRSIISSAFSALMLRPKSIRQVSASVNEYVYEVDIQGLSAQQLAKVERYILNEDSVKKVTVGENAKAYRAVLIKITPATGVNQLDPRNSTYSMTTLLKSLGLKVISVQKQSASSGVQVFVVTLSAPPTMNWTRLENALMEKSGAEGAEVSSNAAGTRITITFLGLHAIYSNTGSADLVDRIKNAGGFVPRQALKKGRNYRVSWAGPKAQALGLKPGVEVKLLNMWSSLYLWLDIIYGGHGTIGSTDQLEYEKDVKFQEDRTLNDASDLVGRINAAVSLRLR